MPDAVGSAAAANNPMVKSVSNSEPEVEVPDCGSVKCGSTDCEVDCDRAEEAPPQLDHPALRDTGNGPDVSYEMAALEALYGPPDADGVYGKGAPDEA